MKTAGILTALPFLFLAASGVEAETRGIVADDGQFRVHQSKVDQEMSELLRNLPEATPVRRPGPPQPAPVREEIPNSPSQQPAIVVSRDPSAAEGAVAAFANRFWSGHLDELRAALWRMSRIRPEIESILAEEGVPPRFAAVVLVESGASPATLSPKAALGFWQIQPDTARQYGLMVSPQQDDRIDLVKSTRAAARYLRGLYQMFGNWRLALAAYNAGEGALWQAIRRGGSFNFQVLSDRGLIPAETRMYVPAVLAAVDLLSVQGSSTMELGRGQFPR